MLFPPDNPVWQALSSHQAHFNMGSNSLMFFPANVSPFVGMQHWDERDWPELMNNLPANRPFSVMIARQVQLPENLEIVFTCPLYQMCCFKLIPSFNRGLVIRKLGYEDVPQMLDLTSRTKPGPFLEKTIDMGGYYGIFEQGMLVSLAGERLRLNGFTEISAICTDPSRLGRGYASVLTSHVAQSIFVSGEIPFLHVKTDNLRAIEVYRRVGFEVRTEVYFAIFRKR
jgi:ribosomal protein S18 acetylase RimI-like enzyme